MSNRNKNIALWVLQALTASAFLLAGSGALSGQPKMVETFGRIGVGQWFRYVTGGIEVASAVLLLIPQLAPVGAGLLICTMIGAVLAHLFVVGGAPVPALALLCSSAIILGGRFNIVRAWFGEGSRSSLPQSEALDAVTTPSDSSGMISIK